MGQSVASDLDGQALAYTETTPIDARLVEYDLLGSLAHSMMLTSTGVLGSDDGRALVSAILELIDEQASSGKIDLDPKLEDVHLNIESRLIARIGIDRGGYLNTARSRNDQIVLDTKLYLRDALLDRINETLDLCDIMLERAEGEAESFLVGHTHSQSAQPISVGRIRSI